MLRILGRFSLYGSRDSLARIASIVEFPSAVLEQIGQKRRTPEKDSWAYSSPWYRFELNRLDEQVAEFLDLHKGLGDALARSDVGISHAMFTLCPVEQSGEQVFSCLLSHKTISLLSALRLALEISPAPVMPEVEDWRGNNR